MKIDKNDKIKNKKNSISFLNQTIPDKKTFIEKGKVTQFFNQNFRDEDSDSSPDENLTIYLPSKKFRHLHKKTLILDLDETLIHSSFDPIPNCNITSQVI